jgi:hypothetical protein
MQHISTELKNHSWLHIPPFELSNHLNTYTLTPTYQLPEYVYTLAKSDWILRSFKFGYVIIVQLTDHTWYPWFLRKKVTQSLILKFTAFSTADRSSQIHGTNDKRRYTQCRVGHLIISFGATKPPAHPEDGDGVCSQNIRKPSHLDVAACPRKFNCNAYFFSTVTKFAWLQQSLVNLCLWKMYK